MKDKIKILIAIVVMVFGLSVCYEDPYEIEAEYPEIITSQGLILIRGANVLNSTMTISTGTTVKFESICLGGQGGGWSCVSTPDDVDNSHPGILSVTQGGKLIAQGTADNPIVFENSGDSTGNLVFEENASNESVLEYCEFKGDINIQISNSMMVQYCKFTGGSGFIETQGDSACLIQKNNMDAIAIQPNSLPTIQYNSFSDDGLYMVLPSSPTIENNNFIGTKDYAMCCNTSSYTVTSNYVYNCKEKSGVDTDGSQSWRIIYINPLPSAISEAGCGW